MRIHNLLLGSVLLASCGGGTDPAEDPIIRDSCSGFVGDQALPAEAEILVMDAAGQVAPIAGGARVPLVEPPQGGKVIFATVRARNLDSCAVQLTGYLRDGAGEASPIVGLERRPVDFKLGDDGWAYPAEPAQLSSYANIPLCPNLASTRDIYEQPYPLTIDVVDGGGRRASAGVTVTPYCSEPAREAECLCTCGVDYTLGECPAR